MLGLGVGPDVVRWGEASVAVHQWARSGLAPPLGGRAPRAAGSLAESGRARSRCRHVRSVKHVLTVQ